MRKQLSRLGGVALTMLMAIAAASCSGNKVKTGHDAVYSDRFAAGNLPGTLTLADGETLEAKDRLWVRRYPDYDPRKGQISSTFTRTIFDYSDDDAVGLIDLYVIGRNAGLTDNSENQHHWGAPYYKVRLVPHGKKAEKFLQTASADRYLTWDLRNDFPLDIDVDDVVLPYRLPSDRQPGPLGYLETDWTACPRCFGLSMDGEQLDDPALQRLAASFGHTGAWAATISDSGELADKRYRIHADEFLVGDAAVTWAERTGTQLIAQRERIGKAPAEYRALVKAYQRGAPLAALEQACPDPLEWRINHNQLPDASAIYQEIDVMAARTERFGQCADKFLDHYDLSAWQNSLAAFDARENQLAETAEYGPGERTRMTAAAEQTRLQNYIGGVAHEFKQIERDYSRLAGQVAQREQEKARRARQIEALDQAGQRAVARFNANMARVQQQNAKLVAKADALRTGTPPAPVIPLLSGPEAVAAGYGTNADGSAKTNRYSAILQGSNPSRPAATTASDNQTAEKDSSTRASSTASRKHSTTSAASRASDEPATEEVSPKESAPDSPPSTETTDKSTVAAAQPAPPTTPETATTVAVPDEPFFLYQAVTAKHEEEDLGDAKRNIIFDVDGQVVRSERFYRDLVFCGINHGKVLIIEWDFTGMKTPPTDLYFDTAGGALDDWLKRYHVNEAGSALSTSADSLKARYGHQSCASYKSGFTDF